MIRLLWFVFGILISALIFYWCNFDLFSRKEENLFPAVFILFIAFIVFTCPYKLPGEK